MPPSMHEALHVQGRFWGECLCFGTVFLGGMGGRFLFKGGPGMERVRSYFGLFQQSCFYHFCHFIHFHNCSSSFNMFDEFPVIFYHFFIFITFIIFHHVHHLLDFAFFLLDAWLLGILAFWLLGFLAS